jgi:hypothetical protein
MLTFSHPGSRIQGSKKHPIPDHGSATLPKSILETEKTLKTLSSGQIYLKNPINPKNPKTPKKPQKTKKNIGLGFLKNPGFSNPESIPYTRIWVSFWKSQTFGKISRLLVCWFFS